ncbi:MAG: hypothetical protein SPC25_05760 [Atopobiaceae bacterium]|nr:hypothetical protein [Atopobiaceae bacterium]
MPRGTLVAGDPNDGKQQIRRAGRDAITRRQALRLLMGVGASLALAPATALARPSATKETTEKLEAAKKRLKEVQDQLKEIGAEYSKLAIEQSKTLDKIEEVRSEIDATQDEIDSRQAQLEQKQEVLAKRIGATYKSGGTDMLSVLLASSSFEELASNLYVMDKVNKSDQELINEVKDAKAQLERTKASLESQEEDLEKLNEEQKKSLEQMKAKKEKIASIMNGLDSDVKSLMAQYDKELLESQQAEEAERQASEQYGGSLAGTGGSPTGNAQERIVYNCRHVGSPGVGLCAMWVSMVYQKSGLGYPGGNACDMYANFCRSSNRANLKPGMAVAVSTHPHTLAGSIYGHIGIYIGNGVVMDNVGYIRTISLSSWISYYGSVVPVRWGFCM